VKVLSVWKGDTVKRINPNDVRDVGANLLDMILTVIVIMAVLVITVAALNSCVPV